MPIFTNVLSGKIQSFLCGSTIAHKSFLKHFGLKSLLLFAAFVISISNSTGQVYREWIGTGNWTTGANWTNGTYDYAQLEFKGNGNATSNNDANPASQWRLYFSGTKAYTITGNAVNLFDYSSNNSWILSQSTVAQTINTSIGFNDAGTRTSWITTQNSGTLTLGGNVSIAGGVTALRIAGANTSGIITINGAISGSGKPIDIGRDESDNAQVNTRVFFNGTNTYSGVTTIFGGTLSVASNAALGSGSLIIGNSTTTTTLAVTGTTSRSQDINVIDLSAAAVVDVAAGQTFTLSGNLTGGATNSTKYGKAGAGTLIISGTSNTYNGQVQIGDGALVVQSSLGTNTSTANRGIDLGLNVGDGSTANNVALQATNGITVGQSIYVASNTSGASRTISLNGSGAATFSNEIYTDGDLTLSGGLGAITISGNIVSPASNKGIIVTGGVVILSGNNTYTGTTTVSNGTLRIGAAERIVNTSNIVLGGGTLSTGSGAGNSETVGTLNLGTSSASTIALGTGNHTLTFANSSSLTPWGTGATLTITGWAGIAGQSNTSGGRIFVSSATGLTAAQLAKITFQGYLGTPIILNTGEVVPPGPSLSVTSGVLNHGSSCVGLAASTITYTITNTGGTATGISVGSSNSSEFTVSNVPASVTGAGGTATYQVTFTPGASGSRSSIITINTTSSNSNAPLTSSLTGTGKVSVGLGSASATATPICSAATTTLTYTGLTGDGASVTWYDGTTGTTGAHGTGTPSSAVGPGTYHARATGDCGSPVEITVVVAAKADVALTSASATATPICSAATTTLTYTGLTGDGASVTWYDGAGATGSTHGTGTPSSAVGPGTYYAYATGDCGSPVEISVTVNSLTNTSISVDAAPTVQTLFINDPSPTAISITAAGASLSYQWYYNTANSNNPVGATTVGTNSNSYTPPTNVLGTKYYFCVVTGTCGTATSSTARVTITNSNTWTAGAATTNWSTGGNWSLGTPPNSTNDAVIPFGNTPYPVLSASSAINDLIIDNGATVGIGAGNTFTITGTVTGTGTLSGSATSNLITSSSTTLLFTSGSNTLKNLNVNSGTLTLGNALNITGGTAANTYGTVTVATGATLASGGNLTIQSNQFGTARVAAGDAAGNYITGDVTVERYIPANSKRSWRLLSVPTKGTKTIKQTWQENQAPLANGTPGFGTLITSNIATTAASQAAGFDAFSQLPSMQSYNSGTQGWVYVTSTNSAPIQTNKGYFLYIRGDRSVTTSSSTDAAGATVLRTTGTLYQGNSNPAVSIAAGKFEPVGNTFASAVDFSGLAKTGGISNTFYVWDSKLLSGTTLGAYQTFNGAIGFTPATPGGSYPSGVSNTSIESGEAIMLGAVGSAGTVALVESSKIAGNEFTPFRPSALPAQFKTSLLKVTGSTTVFADNNIVVFDRAYANVVDANDALKIQKAGETMSIVTDSKSLIVDARQPVAPGDVIRFNMGNLQPQAYKLSFTTQNMNTTGLTAFVEDKYLYSSTAINLDAVSDYTFTVDAANAASSAKDRFSVVFKKVGAAAIAVVQPVFVISPNPVEGGVVNVEFKNQVAGKYGIRLLDAGGAVIFSTFATHGGGTGSQRLSLPSGISRGSYQLEITAPGKSRELQTLFIHTSK